MYRYKWNTYTRLYKIDERCGLTCQAACPPCKPFQNLAAPGLARFAPTPKWYIWHSIIFHVWLNRTWNIISFSPIKHFQLILRLSSVSPGQGLPHVRESDTRQELRNKFGIICKKLSGFVGKLSGCVGILSGFVGKLSAFVGILSCWWKFDFHRMSHLASVTVCLSSWWPAPPPSSSSTWSSLGIEQKNCQFMSFNVLQTIFGFSFWNVNCEALTLW